MWLPGLRTFPGSKPTVKLKLAAVRMLYDFLVVRQITPSNPAHSVRGPKYVVKKGKTPVWSREDAKTLLRLNPQGFGVRIARPGAHCRDALQLRPCQRSPETQSGRLLSQWRPPAAETTGGHLFVATHPGQLLSVNMVGFAAIGSGALHAAIRLSLGQHTAASSLEEAVFNVHEAKKSCPE